MSASIWAMGILIVLVIALISMNIAAAQVGRDCYEETKEGDGKTNYGYLGFMVQTNIFGLIFVILFGLIGVVVARSFSLSKAVVTGQAIQQGRQAYNDSIF